MFLEFEDHTQSVCYTRAAHNMLRRVCAPPRCFQFGWHATCEHDRRPAASSAEFGCVSDANIVAAFAHTHALDDVNIGNLL